VKKAIETEAARLTALLENGEQVRQETRSFDANKETTSATREKEDADDYRYFAEPDLTPFHLEDDFIETIRQSIPALQEERIKKYMAEWKLSLYDATVLTEERAFADYFEGVVSCLRPANAVEGSLVRYKAAANWMLGPVRSWLNETGMEITGFPVTTEQLAGLILLIDSGKIGFSVASSKIFPQFLEEQGKTAEQVATELNLLGEPDPAIIEEIIDRVLEKFAGKVTAYKKGKKGLLALFVGEVMKQSKGKADPKLTNELLLEKLK
jgi:aspartyl-tRNA(Asn)/glutamyl-tRNA(Gln) amidotransferase subunit B